MRPDYLRFCNAVAAVAIVRNSRTEPDSDIQELMRIDAGMLLRKGIIYTEDLYRREVNKNFQAELFSLTRKGNMDRQMADTLKTYIERPPTQLPNTQGY